MNTPNDESLTDDIPISYKPGLITMLIIFLLVLSMLATLIWPFLYPKYRSPTPTATPLLLPQVQLLP